MDRIIAGRFQTRDSADNVAVRIAQFVDTGNICIFHNNPPGQHDVHPAGGDEAVDPSAQGAGLSSVSAAAVAGVAAGAIGAVGGPVTALAAGATGAYLGSLAGALQGLGDDEGQHVHRRPGGVMLSVRISEPQIEKRVIKILHVGGAADIEQADGEWRDGDWSDFNPLATPRLVNLSQE